MTIHLPGDLESSIEAIVKSGRFASFDDAMAEAARLLLREIQQTQSEPTPTLLQRRRPVARSLAGRCRSPR